MSHFKLFGRFLGSKWRMKMFEAFYTNGGKSCESRLAHLRAGLDEVFPHPPKKL